MTLKTFKTVTRNVNGRRPLRKNLKEDIYGADISNVKVVTIASNASSEEREIGIAEFVWSVRSMPEGENIILTAIAF